jgi:integrase
MRKRAEQPKVKGVYEREPGSDIWWIRYADSQGKERREKVGRRSDAITLYNKRKTEALQGKKLPESIRGKSVTFAELCEDAIEHSTDENGADSTYELRLKVAVLSEAFGQRKAEDITKQDIQRWLLDETEKREWRPGTRNRWQAALSLIFRVGVDNEKIETNPVSRIKRRKENNGRVRHLSVDEEKTLRAAITEPHQLAALEIAIHTGMRRSEQFGLTWRQVDLDARRVTLPKTKNGDQRHIPLNPVALAAFERLKIEGQGKASPVFRDASGEPVSSPRGWFEPAVTRAGLADFHWHDLRHTFASRLVMAGVSLRTVGELMGHKGPSMTWRYAHLAPEHNVDAVNRLAQPVLEPVQAVHGNG